MVFIFISNNKIKTNLKQQAEMREYLYKILVVGDLGTGKTSIIRRYVHNIFSSNYKSTVM